MSTYRREKNNIYIYIKKHKINVYNENKLFPINTNNN